jgi:rhodanese-related sulfurtransferase
MDRVSELMERVGIPGRDSYELPSSEKRFPDGAHYRIEVSGVERPQVLEAMIDESKKRGLPVHRAISVVMGATLLDDEELKRLAKLAAEARIEVILTPGPRAAWDVGRQLVTPEGALSGLRFRGSDGLRAVIADIFRAVELGFRGFLVIDEGLLWLLNELKERGDLPKETTFKVSIYAGHANAAGAKVLQSLGAGTFNPVADLSLPQLASIREAVDIPMDLHVVLAESFGGYMRFYDAPEMARVLAPCYFKIEHGPACAAGPGALYKPWISVQLLCDMVREKVKYAQIIHQIIQENYPEAWMSQAGTEDLAVPRV